MCARYKLFKIFYIRTTIIMKLCGQKLKVLSFFLKLAKKTEQWKSSARKIIFIAFSTTCRGSYYTLNVNGPRSTETEHICILSRMTWRHPCTFNFFFFLQKYICWNMPTHLNVAFEAIIIFYQHQNVYTFNSRKAKTSLESWNIL